MNVVTSSTEQVRWLPSFVQPVRRSGVSWKRFRGCVVSSCSRLNPLFSTGAQRNVSNVIYAYGLCHVTAIAAQPRLQRYTLETSQVHLALKEGYAKWLKRFTQFIHRLKTMVFLRSAMIRILLSSMLPIAKVSPFSGAFVRLLSFWHR